MKSAVVALAVVASALASGANAAEDGPPVVSPHRPERARADAVDPETMQRLEALGYAEWTDVELSGSDDEKDGVVFFDERRAYDGVHLYKSRPRHEAHLMGMRGEILHTWRAADETKPSWDFVDLLPDGHLLASAKYDSLDKLDWNSNVVWSAPIRPHHDLAVGDDGRIYVFTEDRRDRKRREKGQSHLIRDNDIAILSADGEVERRISLWDLFSGDVPRKRLKRIAKKRAEEHYGDVLHANSIELLPRDVPGLGKRGQALISIREIDTIAVVDLDTEEIVWRWGPGELDRQHHPSLLPSLIDAGRILVFDNGTRRKWSRVVEMDPATRAITWELRGDPPSSLFTATRGSSQGLPNGNTLVVESSKGRVFEVTRSGEIVWDFINPDIVEKKGKTFRANIYRMPRLPRSILDALPLRKTRAPSAPRASGAARENAPDRDNQ